MKVFLVNQMHGTLYTLTEFVRCFLDSCGDHSLRSFTRLWVADTSAKFTLIDSALRHLRRTLAFPVSEHHLPFERISGCTIYGRVYALIKIHAVNSLREKIDDVPVTPPSLPNWLDKPSE